MASLHDIDETIKTAIKWGGIGTVIIVLLFMMYTLGINIKEFFYPTPPPPPSASFDKLPPLTFPASTVEGAFSYTVNTDTGDLPVFPDRITIYKLTSPEPDILALRKRQEQVKKIGFLAPPVAIEPLVYQWTDEILPARTLKMNIQTANFTLTSGFRSSPSVLQSTNLPTESEAKNIAQQFLSLVGVFPPDIDPNKTAVVLLTFNPDQTFSKATSLSTASLIRVDFFQMNKDGIEIYYPRHPESIIYLYVGGGPREAQIVETQFYHHAISDTSSTYPIVSSAQAFEELKRGKGHIVSYYGTSNDILIRKVTLGYYLSDTEQTYLMPIVVFEGEDGFLAYVSAIQQDWIQ